MISPQNFRRDVPIKKLEDIVVFKDNLRKPITSNERIEGPYPYYGANGIQGYINDFIFNEELVLLAEDGGHFYDPDRGIAYKVNGKTWVNNHAHVLSPKSNIDINYLWRVLENLDIKEYVNGTTRAKLTKSNALQIKIPLPPLAEQKRIAAILDKANEIKVKHELTLAKLNVLAQSIFIDMFGDPEKNLMGWEYRKLSDLVTKLGDGIHGTPAYSEDGEYYFINGNNLHHGVITTSATTKKVSFDEFNKHKRELNKSTMLVSINGTIGKVAFYNEEKIILGKSACYFNANESLINKTYLFYLIESPYFIKYATSTATGSTIKNVSLKSMRNFPIPMPPLALQEKYFKQIESIEKIKSIASRAVIKQKYLLSSLQNQAFTTGFNA